MARAAISAGGLRSAKNRREHDSPPEVFWSPFSQTIETASEHDVCLYVFDRPFEFAMKISRSPSP